MSSTLETKSRLYALPTYAQPDEGDWAPGTCEAGPWSLESAYAYCKAFAASRSENFHVASGFVPTKLHRHVWAIYAFARHADDFADEATYEGERLEALDRWEELLEQAYRRQVAHPVFMALGDTVRKFDIPLNDLKALLIAYRLDLRSKQVNTYRELARYCSFSASPIGRVMLYLHGYRESKLHRFSDDLCAGVQISSQLQNIAQDLERGRCYLPMEDLMHFGVSVQELQHSPHSENVHDLMRFSISRARMLLVRGQPLVRRVDAELAAELQATWLASMQMLERIEDKMAQRPVPGPERGAADSSQVALRTAFSFGPRFFKPSR